MDLREFLSRLEGVKAGSGGEYICKCPAHDDRTASLCVRDGEKGIVLKCQAGCPTEAVLAQMGLNPVPVPADVSLPVPSLSMIVENILESGYFSYRMDPDALFASQGV